MARKIKSDLLKKTIILIIFIIWFIIVFLFSNQTGAESGKVSEKVTKKLLQTKDSIEIAKDNKGTNESVKNNPITKRRIDKWEVPVRKMAHYILFLCGGFIIYILSKYLFEIKNNTAVIAVFLGLLIACSDEFHQIYTFNRTPKILDVGIDTAGIITGVILSIVIVNVFETIKNKNQIKDNT